MADPQRFLGGAAVGDRLTAALRHRRTDQWRKLPRLCREAGSRAHPRAGRHRRVMDESRQFHKGGRAIFAQRLRAAKAKLFFLPAYSPQTSIRSEQAFAKMKTLLRKADVPGRIEQTWRTIGSLLDCFTPDRVRHLRHHRRICFSLTRSRSSSLVSSRPRSSCPPSRLRHLAVASMTRHATYGLRHASIR